VDNDGDGFVDFPDDPGCADADGASESPPCSDGVDNDGDGRVDFPSDPECQAASGPTEAQCNDGIDNDGDGRVDFPQDLECRSANAPSESPACSNGLDDDGDGATDFPADDGCASADARSEIRVDLNFNGVADEGDRDVFVLAFGRSEGHPAYRFEADFDGDGVITIVDYQRWLAAYEANGAAQPFAARCGLLGIELLWVVLAAHIMRRARKRNTND
jgi:hypothetical protein